MFLLQYANSYFYHTNPYYLVEIWDNEVPRKVSTPILVSFSLARLILLVENSDRIASGQLDHYTPNPSDTHVR